MEIFDSLAFWLILLFFLIVINAWHDYYICKTQGNREYVKIQIVIVLFDIILFFVLFAGGGIVG